MKISISKIKITGLAFVAFFLNIIFFHSTALAQYGDNAVGGEISAPVLNVDAGVLPDSKFYFLDKFDEWVQKNVFTFGIKSFRAEAYLKSASERIAELQFLSAQGRMTDKIAQDLLQSWRNDLNFSASLIANDFARGGRPVRQTDTVARTLIGSIDVIQNEFAEGENGDSQGFVLADNYFIDEAEKEIIFNLLREDVVVPEQVWRLVIDNLKFDAERNFERMKHQLENEKEDRVMRLGATDLLKLAEQDRSAGKNYYDAGDFQNALNSYLESESALRMAANNGLVIDLGAVIEREELKKELDEAADRLMATGLIGGAEIFADRQKIEESYGD